MISGGGMRLGDILTASNGKTIEIVDLATLTGACIVALGTDIGDRHVNQPQVMS